MHKQPSLLLHTIRTSRQHLAAPARPPQSLGITAPPQNSHRVHWLSHFRTQFHAFPIWSLRRHCGVGHSLVGRGRRGALAGGGAADVARRQPASVCVRGCARDDSNVFTSHTMQHRPMYLCLPLMFSVTFISFSLSLWPACIVCCVRVRVVVLLCVCVCVVCVVETRTGEPVLETDVAMRQPRVCACVVIAGTTCLESAVQRDLCNDYLSLGVCVYCLACYCCVWYCPLT
jgi:hypothetical protein